VISPLLANIYLQYVYDLWTHKWAASQGSRSCDRRAVRRRQGVGFQVLAEA